MRTKPLPRCFTTRSKIRAGTPRGSKSPIGLERAWRRSSRARTESDLHPKPPWRERKEAHLARLLTADRSVQLVVAADKLHNVGSLIADYGRLGEKLWSHFRGGKAGTLWYLRAAVAALPNAPPELVAQLNASIGELERLSGQSP